MEKTAVILGLGSNVGDREANLRTACDALSTVLSGLRRSSLYESAALLPEGAPDAWDNAFLNMAVCGECALSPRELLSCVKAVEQEIGRQLRGHWAPREIDIDILAMGDAIVAEEGLRVPHPEMEKRDFVLVPLAEIAPFWRHPKLGMGAAELLARLDGGNTLRVFRAA